MKKRLMFTCSLALAGLVALAAYNDDDDNGDDAGSSNGSGSSIEMEMGEMYFEPDSISADGSSTLNIDIENAGNQLHDFTIDDLNGERVHVEVPAGDSESFSLNIPDGGGDIEFYCSIPGHRASGMEGVITIN